MVTNRKPYIKSENNNRCKNKMAECSIQSWEFNKVTKATQGMIVTNSAVLMSVPLQLFGSL